MSRGFVKEGDQEEIPMVLPRAFLPKGTPNYVTPEGLKKLHDEMDALKKEWTDAGSNYVTKNYLDAKMRLLSERINSAVLIDPSKSNHDVVSFGMYVKYNDKLIRIVGVDEADASNGLISFISPIAKALIGKKKGDKFEIKVPRGTETIEILEISHRVAETQCRDVSMKPKTSTNIDASKENKSQSCKVSETQSHRENSESDSVSKSVSSSKSESTSTSASESESKSKSSPTTEFLPLVNEQGNIIGRALHLEIHNGNKLLHPAVHLLVYNSKKEIVAEYWWHVAFGETAEKTLKRKLNEMESQTIKPKFDKRYIREDKNEKELVSAFTAVFDGEM